eukprot:jgi/Phyca11/20054/fgenesh1_pg.PHYCAscaffold_57_\
MKFFRAISALMTTCALTSSSVSADASGGAPWGYKNAASMAGPTQWSKYYPMCGGSRQSPIDITTTRGNVAKRSLAFSGECADFNVTQTADSFKASVIGVGVFLQVVNGRTDPFMVSVLDGLDNLNTPKGKQISLGPYSELVNANANRLYNYPGSLTTPGCDEIVDWWVVQKPVSVSPKDFKRLQAQLKKLPATDNGKNARPVMPLNGRRIISLQ